MREMTTSLAFVRPPQMSTGRSNRRPVADVSEETVKAVALPLYARVAAIGGRPIVLAAALAMSAPGEYALAVEAGWSQKVAWLMPVVVSVYAAVAAVIVATRPKGSDGRRSALAGALAALTLALAAQVVAHLMAAGFLTSGPFLVAATSAVPPVVVAHMLHLAAMPRVVKEEFQDLPAHAAHPTAQEMVQDAQYQVASQNRVHAARMSALNDQPGTKADTETDTSEDADTAPDNVVDMDKTSHKAVRRGRTLEEILTAVRFLEDSGQEVNGTTYAQHVGGISTRTGRRDLARIGITTAA